jgi:hypothetical protein|tara:strand:- start:385 stop:600 length:216 start_codon:yes stop_codon:yes gene_type:complete
MNGVVYSGSYTCEGHTVHFVINDDDTVDITEVTEMKVDRIGNTYTSTRNVDIDEAIKIQQEFLKLGYDKIS